MDKSLSPRRLAENEVFFRQRNRAIEDGFEKVKKLAIADSQDEFIDRDDMPLYFFCECSDADCRTRIPLKRSQYDQVHKANNRFVIVCGHEVPAVEIVIEKTDDYCVIQKKVEPPRTSNRLSPNTINVN